MWIAVFEHPVIQLDYIGQSISRDLSEHVPTESSLDHYVRIEYADQHVFALPGTMYHTAEDAQGDTEFVSIDNDEKIQDLVVSIECMPDSMHFPQCLTGKHKVGPSFFTSSSEKNLDNLPRQLTDIMNSPLAVSPFYAIPHMQKRVINLANSVIVGVCTVAAIILSMWYYRYRLRLSYSHGTTKSEQFFHDEKEEPHPIAMEGPPKPAILVPNSSSVILGKLRIDLKCIIGYGSHGTLVYKGEFEGRHVAVKRLLPEFYDIAEKEIRLLRDSDHHPNIIRYYCMVRNMGYRFYVRKDAFHKIHAPLFHRNKQTDFCI
jgi:hypothetical protein